ncbi:pantothenate kinase [Humidesulfovibrio mexicanus]|jgi:type III pantothenate kinase|uniref:Type III pantothenate kinase n=1 Tax=Humidesulfovibrio mexicanus TaxID=147047 RepID=A0A239BIJ3_9BACT|nr:type III pantothenate kinase [Humidesulfovibrio mexicanus]SNS07636.1 pantothenate kinase [Humidesulfovibrio mexicanus]
MDTVFLLDVGNTNVKVGLARPGLGLAACYALPTSPADTPDSWGLRLLDICRVENVAPGEVTGFVASSVVPPMNPVLSRAAERFFGRKALFAPGDLPIPIENRYARPAEVGADRLVTACAARHLSDAPALVVVDFGTATTFDCVLGGAFMGGLICPGVLSSARALATGTAKLPHITLEIGPPRPDGGLEIGQSTSQSLNLGLIHGFAAMVEGLAKKLAATLLPGREGEVRVIATGGFAARIAAVCPAIHEVREDLLMEGLWRVWRASEGAGAEMSRAGI